MAEKPAKHPAGSSTSNNVSADGAFVMCPVSFVERISDVMQFVQTCAAPKHIKTLAEDVGSYSNILLAKARADEEWSRRHAHQTATEALNTSQPLQASPGKVMNANKGRAAVKDDVVVEAIKETNELLKKTNSLIEKGTAVTKKGFNSLKPLDLRSLTELIKRLPPPAAGEDENWLSAQTVEESTGESLENLKKQRLEERGGKKITINGSEYGRDSEGRIWFKVSDRVFLYYEATITGQELSR